MHKYKYGPISQGIYLALVYMIPVVALVFTDYLFAYIGLLIFLGIGLRLILERLGIYESYTSLWARLSERVNRGRNQKAAKQVDRQNRDAQYKVRRYKDPNRPKNW